MTYKISEKDLKRIMDRVPKAYYTLEGNASNINEHTCFQDFLTEFNIEEVNIKYYEEHIKQLEQQLYDE